MTQHLALPAVLLLFLAVCVTPALADAEWQTTESGLKYQVVAAGTGESPKRGDIVVVHYTGTFTDGRQFDSSRGGTPFRFTLGQGGVIAGWDEGVALMKQGASFKFHVPWNLAYGAAGRAPKIPAKTDLLFDVELLEIIEPLGLVRPEAETAETLEGGTRYQVLKAGNGEKPTDTQGVSLRMALYNAEGQMVFSTDQAGAPLGGELKSLMIAGRDIPFLRPLVSQLCVGQRVTAEVPGDQGFGANTPDPRILPANAKTYWVIELKSINEIPKFVMPTAEALKTTASGLAYECVNEGDGAAPTRSDTVSVLYTGWLTDGTLFDSAHARGETTTFPVGRVIPGWTEGLQLMKVGSTYRFVIPANLAYGDRAMGALIKPNSTLVFLVELVQIEK